MKTAKNTPSLSLRETKRALVEILGDHRVARVEAAKKLASDASVFPELQRLIRHEHREAQRHALAFALSWQRDLRSWPILLRLFSDESESPVVRGQAAEGLAYLFHRKRRGTAEFNSALRALLRGLEDSSAEVRYFASFAIGASGDRRALPTLRGMMRDRATSAAFVGPVSNEAKAAIKRIQALSPTLSPSGRGRP